MDKHYRDLLIRALKGTLDTASRREFDLWVADADNRRIYENALRIWDDVQRRTSAYNPDRDRLWEQLQSRIEVCGTPQRAERPAPKRRWMPILRTAAAVARGRRRHALRGPSRPLPHTGSGQTGVLRLRRQVAGASDRRFDRMAPERLDARLRQLLRRRKPQRKTPRRGIFRHRQRSRTPFHGRSGRAAPYGFTARNST